MAPDKPRKDWTVEQFWKANKDNIPNINVFDLTVYYKSGAVRKFSYTKEMQKELTERYWNERPSVWGFRWYTGWRLPSKVFQAYLQTGHQVDQGLVYRGRNDHYGDKVLRLPAPGEVGLATSDEWGTSSFANYTFTTKEEAVAKRKELVTAKGKLLRVVNKAMKDGMAAVGEIAEEEDFPWIKAAVLQ